jgi:DNA repair protein RadD
MSVNGVLSTVLAMELRYYQQEAIDSVYQYFTINNGNPLIVLPTGTGKSLVIASFVEGAIKSWSDTRIIVATHVKELVRQNYEEFVSICPFLDTGIYSAGLKRKDTHNQVLFAGIQSVYKKAYDLQRCDVLIVDEAHTIPVDGDGMWRTFIDDLTRINPSMKIIGLTATDYRLSSGLLTSGDIFTDVCYEYPLIRALKDGYLSPVIPKTMATDYDLSKVGTLGGEYKANELEKAVDIQDKTVTAIDEIVAYGANRKSWLIFSAGNAHANHIHEELERRGYKGAVVTQETDRAVRDQAVVDIKNGAIRYLVNNKIFTTGFNAPNIDLIADLGPTKSPGLHVQKMGRGMRLFDGKENCLVLDFARNVDFHGPLDRIKGKDKKKGDGDAPVKICPDCDEVCFAGIRVCFNCGHKFPEPDLKIRTHGGENALLSTQIEPEWLEVIDVTYGRHQKEGKLPTLRVTYTTTGKQVREWVCFSHERGSFAQKKAAEWHKKRLPMLPTPSDVDDALNNVYPAPYRISVMPDGKWDRVVAYDWNAPVIIERDTYEIPY